jgi:hypothetical protein
MMRILGSKASDTGCRRNGNCRSVEEMRAEIAVRSLRRWLWRTKLEARTTFRDRCDKALRIDASKLLISAQLSICSMPVVNSSNPQSVQRPHFSALRNGLTLICHHSFEDRVSGAEISNAAKVCLRNSGQGPRGRSYGLTNQTPPVRRCCL